MKIKTNFLMILISAIALGMTPVRAEKTLSAEEAKELFSGKTFDRYNVTKGRSYQGYSDPDGTMLHKNMKRTKKTTWEIDSEGRHCVKLKKNRCGKIVSRWDGENSP